jgi:hypothetical protein
MPNYLVHGDEFQPSATSFSELEVIPPSSVLSYTALLHDVPSVSPFLTPGDYGQLFEDLADFRETSVSGQLDQA